MRLKKSGRRFWATQWLLINYIAGEGPGFNYGITASRKVGDAVTRNKLKRWVRESVRSYLLKNEMESDVNFIFKAMPKGFYKGIQHSEFERAFQTAMAHITKNHKK